ncbi:MAG TPA: hypothetical protein VEM41_01265 [Actinomycetota bacterium]|nr:hypothetical protein [Actinomycetota bacterium]
MSARVPAAARRALDQGTLCYLAAETSLGPHLTPVVFALDSNALWVTTSRGSVKARAWRRHASAAGLVRAGRVAVAFRGAVRSYDVFDPSTWAGAAAAGPALVGATMKFGLRNARFFAGYAVDASKVPFAWSPPGRVFVRISLDEGVVLDLATGTTLETWGDWDDAPVGSSSAAAFRRLARHRSLDLRAPAPVRRAIGSAGEGALALVGARGTTVLPVHWRRRASEGSYEAVLPVPFAGLARAPARTQAALVVDRLDAWRAAAMRGMMLRGTAQLFSPDAVSRGILALREHAGRGHALVRLRPSSIVWWEGWSGGTVRSSEGGATRRSRSQRGAG